MENQLPLCLKNISYKSVSSYSWKGDLVIVQGSVYFLPTRDLEVERQEAIDKIPLHGAIGMTMQLIVTISERSINDFLKRDKSYLVEQGLLTSEKVSEIQLRKKIETHLEEIRSNGSSFSPLPRPVTFAVSNVKNIILKSRVLCIETDADKYYFKFSRKYNMQIRNALFMAQFKV